MYLYVHYTVDRYMSTQESLPDCVGTPDSRNCPQVLVLEMSGRILQCSQIVTHTTINHILPTHPVQHSAQECPLMHITRTMECSSPSISYTLYPLLHRRSPSAVLMCNSKMVCPKMQSRLLCPRPEP